MIIKKVKDCNVPSGAVAVHPLLIYSFEVINQPNEAGASTVTEATREAAIDLLIDVLRKYDAREENIPLVQVFFPPSSLLIKLL
jgi:hypothetical protein